MTYRKIFDETIGADSYQRIDSNSIIKWYLGKDNRLRYSLFGIVSTEPKNFMPTQVIDVYVGLRKDGRYGITFSLTDESALDLFVHFCEDMVYGSEKVRNEEKATGYILGRFLLWQKIFSRKNGGFLSFEEIKGLIGEIVFLKDYLLPQYDESLALGSWSGTEMTDQDFSINDTWYEVKTTVSGSSSVKISSVEQLDCNNIGHLAVVTLDKTSESDSARITLNSAYTLLCESLELEENVEKFKYRMLTYGYVFDKYYDKYGFRLKVIDLYKVDENFPCIRAKNIPSSASNVKYELNLSSIQTYKEV